jgi:hypothetical protein
VLGCSGVGPPIRRPRARTVLCPLRQDVPNPNRSPRGAPCIRLAGRRPGAEKHGEPKTERQFGADSRSWWLMPRPDRPTDPTGVTREAAESVGDPWRGWRRGWDSNPREAFDLYSLSRGAPSTTRPPLRCRPDRPECPVAQGIFRHDDGEDRARAGTRRTRSLRVPAPARAASSESVRRMRGVRAAILRPATSGPGRRTPWCAVDSGRDPAIPGRQARHRCYRFLKFRPICAPCPRFSWLLCNRGWTSSSGSPGCSGSPVEPAAAASMVGLGEGAQRRIFFGKGDGAVHAVLQPEYPDPL